MTTDGGTQLLSIEMHGHEDRNGIEGRVYPAVVQIESVIGPLDRRDVDVHPLDWLVTGIVDRMGVAHAAECAGRRFKHRSAAVDRELRFPVEDHEHLFTGVVEVSTDAALRLDDASMQKEKIGVERMEIEEGHKIERARPAVDGRTVPEFSGIRMSDPGGQGLAGNCWGRQAQCGKKRNCKIQDSHLLLSSNRTPGTRDCSSRLRRYVFSSCTYRRSI